MNGGGDGAVKDGPTGPSAASRPAESLTAIGDRAPPCRQGGKLDIGAFARTAAGWALDIGRTRRASTFWWIRLSPLREGLDGLLGATAEGL